MIAPIRTASLDDDYRPDIDRLRALAVVSAVTGGFVGVDIFFVISGFLISKILFGELAEDRFSLTIFYGRRIGYSPR